MNEIEDIKSRVDLVELAKQYMTLRHAGRNWQALCPFHHEKTPSLTISPDKQIWHCFGCGEGGDIFTLVQKMEGVDFYESLKILADKTGVVLEKKPGFEKIKKEGDKIFTINQLAAEFYHQSMKRSKAGEIAREYLKQRKVSEKMIDQFKIGYAPDMWDALVNFLIKRGYNKTEIVNAGLSTTTRQGKMIDKFRQRLMFPIWDARGRIVAFTGRVLKSEDNPKYLNTPTTRVFDKSKILYALNFAAEKIRAKKQVIFCEGQMDVIACFDAGFDWTVCSSGTAVTKEQLRLIKRMTDNILVAFDNDAAGQKASYRLTQIALEMGLVVKIVNMGEAKDPDELIRSGLDKWNSAVENASGFIEYFLRVLDEGGEVKDKSRLADQIIPLLYYVGDEVEKGFYLTQLADVLDVDKKFVLEKFNKYKPDEKREKSEKVLTENNVSIEDRIVGLLVVFFDILQKRMVDLQEVSFSDKLERIVKFLHDIPARKLSYDEVSAILGESEQEWWRRIVVKVESDYTLLDEEVIVREFEMLVARWKEVSREKIKIDLEKKILQAEKTQDKEKIKEYIRNLQDLIIKGK